MPFYKSTYNILKRPDEDEVFNENWMDSDRLITPLKKEWDYAREMQIEDVDFWEVLYEQGGGIGVYAAWLPYAEFYMMTVGWRPLRLDQWVNDRVIETYYGQNAQKDVFRRCAELGIKIPTYKVWVENDQMWLHQDKSIEKTIILPNRF
jgi:hypothetical protein